MQPAANSTGAMSQKSIDVWVDYFATRAFRDTADGDYITARMASRSSLLLQFLWLSHQAIEKYLKCILLLNRIPCTKATHDLARCLDLIRNSKRVDLKLCPASRSFFDHIQDLGQCRYFEISVQGTGGEIIALDRIVWELRRYCTHSLSERQLQLREGYVAPKYGLDGGLLEEVFKDPKHAARTNLTWQNAFIGRRARKTARLVDWWKLSNGPVINPQILSELEKYVYLPGSNGKPLLKNVKLVHTKNP